MVVKGELQFDLNNFLFVFVLAPMKGRDLGSLLSMGAGFF